MKKILATLSLALIAVATMAQQPVIKFEKHEHDFGKINEADGRVTTIFTFKNEGMSPLVLSNVRASCGCTTPKWTKEPIEPGQTGNITVTYNPNGRPGRFQKTITITSNATESTTRIFIKGEVIPKPAKPINQYTVQMGDLSLKSQSVHFGSVKKGENVTREIEYANLTNTDITIELATREQDDFILSQVTLGTVKPNETGKFSFIFDSKVCKLYGPVDVSVYAVVNGKRIITKDYQISLHADVVEDFSSLTPEQRQQAPIIEMSNQFDLGSVVAGKKIKKNINIKNSGTNPLVIHRVYSTDTKVNCTAPKSIKASPKVSPIKVEINTMANGKPLESGKYRSEIMVITNDPNHPRHTVTLTWTVL